MIEGLIAGCAVIASDVPGVSELIEHERTGWLVPESDPAILAETIEDILAQPKYAEPIVENGQKYAETMFDISTMAINYAKLILKRNKES